MFLILEQVFLSSNTYRNLMILLIHLDSVSNKYTYTNCHCECFNTHLMFGVKQLFIVTNIQCKTVRLSKEERVRI